MTAHAELGPSSSDTLFTKAENLKRLPEGNNLVLREVRLDDSAQIIAWRNDPVLGKFMGREKLTLARQEEFFRSYQSRADDYYFIAEFKRSRKPAGSIAIANLDFATKRGEVARLIVDPGARLFLAEIFDLLLAFAFVQLGLSAVVANVQSRNGPAKNFHVRLGFQIDEIAPNAWWNGDDVITFRMSREDYPRLKQAWSALLLDARES
ncbi:MULTISPECIES: GNAT family N-acetyltransferase [unclassified Bradyrhizobium]|uniref:GNAT family N-acetyltransferase n=1 Tax=unclassified Bradyrhizobium TaxID=2631580 RepID=UPI00181ED386|nr:MULTISPECIES: GNAT family N-acetyltransferase [unclassified Bradyrhizobium]MBB4256502.1 RimJ/RimL family protein N-acetyltransferase [Bradyrhizobium sp. CIR3A]MBB4362437.1 RimJ/RimL family protein N-acetyltransferase [Bradyrhizobium sp. CIR18]MBB4395681.1 RimJ/RimL family protein N-acetyltransferase [Bradyrhizobium sp. ERR14]NYG43471.1 RimJ/RimL family protein N-acetyltransferase [Bradyrhizobium sp. IAR9]